jgi:hypothetical protein
MPNDSEIHGLGTDGFEKIYISRLGHSGYFKAGMFIFAGHRPVMDKALKTESE